MEDSAYEEYKVRWWHRLSRRKKVLAILTISASIFGLGYVIFKIRFYLAHTPSSQENLTQSLIQTLDSYEELTGDELSVSLEAQGSIRQQENLPEGYVIELEGRAPLNHSRSVYPTIQKIRQILELGLKRAKLG